MSISTPDEAFARAKELGAHGRCLEAASLLEEAQGRWPGTLRLLTEQIEMLVLGYRFDDARERAAHLETTLSDQPRAARFLAGFATRLGRWQEAEERFEAIMAKEPQAARGVMNDAYYRQAVFNRHGILAGSRKLAPVTHAEAQSQNADRGADREAGDPVAPASYVFVSGMPRSGTTALGHLLNLSTEVALFTELHNYYFTYAPSSFSPEMLARKHKVRPTVISAEMIERAGKAAFVGDKRPLFHYALPHTLAAMADRQVTVFHLLRPVLHVAASYHARAANPEDIWEPLRDIGLCIDEMNVMHRFLLGQAAAPQGNPAHRLVFVDYHRVFSDTEYAAGLFTRLGAACGPALRAAIEAFQTKSAAVIARDRSIDPVVIDSIARGLDMEAAREVSVLTGTDILAGI